MLQINYATTTENKTFNLINSYLQILDKNNCFKVIKQNNKIEIIHNDTTYISIIEIYKNVFQYTDEIDNMYNFTFNMESDTEYSIKKLFDYIAVGINNLNYYIEINENY